MLVSTDKAVSPATVMGASKALAEWAVEAAQHRYPGTRYASVRFGNVLGSSGSVVPIFRRQIAAGRPGHGHRREHDALLHDDPRGGAADHPLGRARRRGGEVFVLEMGEPVKIVDLARQHDPARRATSPTWTSRSRSSAARPGEKLHEELFNPGERPQPTPAEKIVCAVHPPLDPDWVESAFARIEELVYGG